MLVEKDRTAAAIASTFCLLLQCFQLWNINLQCSLNEQILLINDHDC